MACDTTISQRGFTLIELLVVIAIIGLLSSVVLASLNTVRYKGFDSTRYSDLRQMETVLDSYYADYGSYPVATGGSGVWYTACSGVIGMTQVTPENNIVMNGGTTIVSLGYISSIPSGPLTDGVSKDCYAYKSSGTNYKFMDYNPANPTTQTFCSNPAGKYFKDPNYGCAVASVYSSGGSSF
jgi:prepilin-type N-terminal cleavage/methylation domain-containing protein